MLSVTLQRLMRHWWVVAAAIVIGGVIGSLFPLMRKPMYESTSVISTSIDFAYSGKLSELQQDQMIVAIGNLISSSDVFQAVQAEADGEGIPLTDEELITRFVLSRQGYQWELSTRSENPAEAQKLNAIWLEKAEQNLHAERIASINALKELTTGENLEACFAQSVAVEPASSSCDLEEFQEFIAQVASDDQDFENSQKIFLLSRITTSATREPSFPTKAVVYNRNLTTLAGGLIGLIAVLAFTLITDVKKPAN